MRLHKGWNRQLALDLFEREETYDDPVSTARLRQPCLMQGFEGELAWEDQVINDKAEVTGTEFGLQQEILSCGIKLAYKEPHAKPNTLIGLMALAMGSITSTRDQELNAWSHRIIPVGGEDVLPSVRAMETIAGRSYSYGGLKVNTIKIGGEAGKFVTLDAELLGSGSREQIPGFSAEQVQESWLRMSQCKLWMESGQQISLRVPLTQWGQDISCDTARSIGVRLKSFEFSWDNKLEGWFGCGTGKTVFSEIFQGRREASCKLTMLFKDYREQQLYETQEVVAIELDVMGAPIDPRGPLAYGFQLLLPCLRLAKPPRPKGGVGDNFTCEMEFTVQDNGRDPAVIFAGQNRQPGYLNLTKKEITDEAKEQC